MGPRPHLSFCACKTTRIASEILVSIGPSLHLCFMHAKLRLYDQNYKSLWVPALICGVCIQNSEFRIRITSLYGSQTSPVVLWMKNNVISTRITSLYGSQPSFVVFACKIATLGTELQVSLGPRPHLWFLCMQNNVISIRNASLYGSLPSSAVFACQTAALGPELQVSMGPWPHLWYFVFKAATLAPE